MLLVGIHIFLALSLFILLGWIGRHSTGMGYISLSLFITRDDAPAFNFIFRAFSPIVFIVIVSTIFYAIGLDQLVSGIWWVTVWYSVIKIAYNIILGRRLLLNWTRELLLFLTSVSGAWFLYEKVISVRQYLLPDAQSVSTELWIIVALFIYATFNRIEGNSKKSRLRKISYLKHRYTSLKNRYGHLIADIIPDEFSESIVYSIMIYEGFQRPPIFQVLEKLLYPKFSKTLGPMQVNTDHKISNEESVVLGATRIVKSYQLAKVQSKDMLTEMDPRFSKFAERFNIVRQVAVDYNPDDDYASDINRLNQRVIDLFYPSLQNTEDYFI